DSAEQVPQAVHDRGPALPPVPAEVDEEGEEDREGDQAEADEVPVALLERGQAVAPRLRRRGALGASARLTAGSGGHASRPRLAPGPPAPPGGRGGGAPAPSHPA